MEKEFKKIISRNKKARRNYEILDTIEAGVALLGTEVKSCRANMVDLSDAYVELKFGEAYIVNAHISAYEKGGFFNHEPRRKRRLLLHKKQIERWSIKVNERGLTVIPLSCYFYGAKVKIELGLARGKTGVDKREKIKADTDKRDIERALKSARKR